MDIDGEWLPVPSEALPKELRRRVDHFWSNMYHKDGVRLYWPAIPTTYNDDAKKLFSNEKTNKMPTFWTWKRMY